MTNRILLFVIIIWAPISTFALAIPAPEADLAAEAPPLVNVLHLYSAYRPALEHYAQIQGFIRPYEQLATVIHELIHVDSAAHTGYWINGAEYIRPYVTEKQAWPTITNKDIFPKLVEGPIANQYARNTPNNTLANCIDEINAYTHVIGFVRTHEPESLSKQVSALEGHIQMAEVYLDEIRKRGEQLSPEALVVATRVIDYGKKALERSK